MKLAPPVGLALVSGGVLFRKKASQFLVEDDFESIFDGESLSGWTGSRDIWRVENGCIIGYLADERRLKNAFLANQWNSITIKSRSGRISHWLNGKKIVEYPPDLTRDA